MCVCINNGENNIFRWSFVRKKDDSRICFNSTDDLARIALATLDIPLHTITSSTPI